MEQQVMWQQLIKLVKHEVLPALGCTEPISLALAAATATQYIDKNKISRIDAYVSPNLMKNGGGYGSGHWYGGFSYCSGHRRHWR